MQQIYTENLGKSAFFVGSPFQCLCALEAINVFNIKEYDFYIYDTISGADMVIRLLNEKGITYMPIIRKKHLLMYMTLLFKKHPYYKNIFIGNMFDNVSFAISSIFASNTPNLIYLDDGIQALAFFGNSNIQNPLKRKGYSLIFDGIYKLKRLSKKTLFTIYDVKSPDVEIIHNDLNLFKSFDSTSNQGVYIIGTNSSVLKYKDKSYLDYLKSLISNLKTQYPRASLYYCPHRRDTNNHEIFKFCRKNNVFVFDTKISIEYDLVSRAIYPLAVVGFASNALFVLHALYPSTLVQTVHYTLEDLESNTVAKTLERKLNENGIPTILLN